MFGCPYTGAAYAPAGRGGEGGGGGERAGGAGVPEARAKALGRACHANAWPGAPIVCHGRSACVGTTQPSVTRAVPRKERRKNTPPTGGVGSGRGRLLAHRDAVLEGDQGHDDPQRHVGPAHGPHGCRGGEAGGLFFTRRSSAIPFLLLRARRRRVVLLCPRAAAAGPGPRPARRRQLGQPAPRIGAAGGGAAPGRRYRSFGQLTCAVPRLVLQRLAVHGGARVARLDGHVVGVVAIHGACAGRRRA